MIIEQILELIANSKEIKTFLTNTNSYDLFIKKLDTNEIKRIFSEYPKLNNYTIPNNNLSISDFSILSLLLIKKNYNPKDFSEIKKLKLYYDLISFKLIRSIKT